MKNHSIVSGQHLVFKSLLVLAMTFSLSLKAPDDDDAFDFGNTFDFHSSSEELPNPEPQPQYDKEERKQEILRTFMSMPVKERMKAFEDFVAKFGEDYIPDIDEVREVLKGQKPENDPPKPREERNEEEEKEEEDKPDDRTEGPKKTFPKSPESNPPKKEFVSPRSPDRESENPMPDIKPPNPLVVNPQIQSPETYNALEKLRNLLDIPPKRERQKNKLEKELGNIAEEISKDPENLHVSKQGLKAVDSQNDVPKRDQKSPLDSKRKRVSKTSPLKTRSLASVPDQEDRQPNISTTKSINNKVKKELAVNKIEEEIGNVPNKELKPQESPEERVKRKEIEVWDNSPQIAAEGNAYGSNAEENTMGGNKLGVSKRKSFSAILQDFVRRLKGKKSTQKVVLKKGRELSSFDNAPMRQILDSLNNKNSELDKTFVSLLNPLKSPEKNHAIRLLASKLGFSDRGAWFVYYLTYGLALIATIVFLYFSLIYLFRHRLPLLNRKKKKSAS